jgi:light-regulated signal transduction histidine kinase (bacteriophytochrome)
MSEETDHQPEPDALQRAEEHARQLTLELASVNQELDSLCYAVSHDLRAPLRAVDGFAHIVAEEHSAQFNEEGRRMFDLIQREILRMNHLMDGLLIFSRLGRQKMESVQIDMHALAQSVFDEWAARSPDRHLHLDLHPLPPAIGDLPMMRQVWRYLIDNAIKFTQGRNPAEIEIGTRTGEAGELVYYIKDNGVGFDMRLAGKLFGIFQRFHGEGEFPGVASVGLGLALVQRIIHRHGGRVWAESEVNAGATFFFTLPQPLP